MKFLEPNEYAKDKPLASSRASLNLGGEGFITTQMSFQFSTFRDDPRGNSQFNFSRTLSESSSDFEHSQLVGAPFYGSA